MKINLTRQLYIFLDVDGVLNNYNHYSKQHEKYGGKFFMQNMPFNPKSLQNLRKIIDKTGAQIVLTSSWRKSAPCMTVLEARLCEYGIKIYDKTGDVGSRGNEIIDWLFENTIDGDEFIIIDDELYDLQESFSDMRIYKIDPKYGLDRKATNGILERINQMMK